MTQQEDIARWLRLFVQPEQVVELRALTQEGQRLRGRPKCLSLFFNCLDALAQIAVELESEGAKGVYFTPNPLNPELLRSVRSANDGDVLEKRWFLLDVDCIRPMGMRGESSTEEEREKAWEQFCRCRELLGSIGLEGIPADSGNGWHLNCPVRLPSDEHSTAWHREILKWLKSKTNPELADIDTTVCNPSRIWKLYGTKSAKGKPTPLRPHRWSRVIEE